MLVECAYKSSLGNSGNARGLLVLGLILWGGLDFLLCVVGYGHILDGFIVILVLGELGATLLDIFVVGVFFVVLLATCASGGSGSSSFLWASVDQRATTSRSH